MQITANISTRTLVALTATILGLTTLLTIFLIYQMYRYEIGQFFHRLSQNVPRFPTPVYFLCYLNNLIYYEHPGGAFLTCPYDHLTVLYQDDVNWVVNGPDNWAFSPPLFRSRTISNSLVKSESRTIPALTPPEHELKAKLCFNAALCQPLQKSPPHLMIPVGMEFQARGDTPYYCSSSEFPVRAGSPSSDGNIPSSYPASRPESSTLPYHLRVNPEPYSQEPSPSATNYTHEPSPVPSIYTHEPSLVPMVRTWRATNGTPGGISPPPTTPDSNYGSG
ncbi:uncharacterized protein ARMOST_16178 [Armillaria ostoyae]|uniref:Uncharacterized protein n=1 Tax=Armillaria ostoyae TaxID=47428 RepID=A0A284RVH8_ARMOS|nr:uncharacterized protein ARMOST_16178 [Armillaria ostoyae]